MIKLTVLGFKKFQQELKEVLKLFVEKQFVPPMDKFCKDCCFRYGNWWRSCVQFNSCPYEKLRNPDYVKKVDKILGLWGK